MSTRSLVASLLLGVTALAGAIPSPRAAAQTVGGIVRDRATQGVVQGITVALLDSTRHVVALARSDPGGTFYVDAPRPGRYAVIFAADSLLLGERPPVELQAGAFHQEEFLVEVLARVAVAFDAAVDEDAKPASDNRAPEFLRALREWGVRGRVAAQFVVDADGHVDPRTLRILAATDPQLAASVSETLPTWRYVPARVKGEPVRQLVRIVFDFRMAGA
jgi:F0F1-type ATP synthase membrane subunit c/vacuolar-type H+-ATPase subunit K